MKKPKEEQPDETGLEPLYKVNEQIEKLYKKRKEIVESLAKDYNGRQINVKYDTLRDEIVKFLDVKGERLTYGCLLSEFPSKDDYKNIPVEYQIDFCIAWHRAWTELQQEQLSA